MYAYVCVYIYDFCLSPQIFTYIFGGWERGRERTRDRERQRERERMRD